DPALDVTLDRIQLASKPADVLLDALLDRPGGQGQAVLFRRDHVLDLPPAGKERIEEGGLFVGQRSGLGPDSLGKEGKDVCINVGRVCVLTSGLCKVANLAGSGDHDRKAGKSKSRGHAGLIASSGFKDDERVRKPPEPPKEEIESSSVIACSPAHAAGQERN